MKNIFSILAAVIAVALPAQGEMGFYFFDEGSEPLVLASVSENVFQLVAPSGPTRKQNIKGWGSEQIQKFSVSRSAGRWRPDLRSRSLLWQLERCRSRSIEVCVYQEDLKTSTAFALAEPAMIVSSYHGIESHITYLMAQGESLEQLKKMSLSFMLLNSRGEIVQDSLNPIDFFPSEDFHGDVAFFNRGTLRVSGLPFHPAAHLDAKKILYAVGFPEATTGRERFGGENARLDVLSYTMGYPTNVHNLRLSRLTHYISRHAEEDLSSNPLVITSNDSAAGMSGGPLINHEGYVVGALVSGVESRRKKISIFLNLLQLIKERP